VGVYDAEYVLFTLPIRGDERGAVEDRLRDGSYGVVALEPSVALMRRGHDTARNRAALRRL
jgi:hypothetical protein